MTEAPEDGAFESDLSSDLAMLLINQEEAWLGALIYRVY